MTILSIECSSATGSIALLRDGDILHHISFDNPRGRGTAFFGALQESNRHIELLDLVLVGRSNNVGKPALWLGLARGATVISAHHHTAAAGRLERHTREADILVVAAGVPHLITGEMVKPGAIVIDVGINPLRDPETGKVRMVGDVDTESVAAVAEAVSPVPGGVGPITDVTLLANTVLAARLQARRHEA